MFRTGKDGLQVAAPMPHIQLRENGQVIVSGEWGESFH
jgi:hypothetical protein